MSFCAKWFTLLATASLLMLAPQSAMTSDEAINAQPWENFSAHFGVFLSTIDSSVRLGAGIGLNIMKRIGLEPGERFDFDSLPMPTSASRGTRAMLLLHTRPSSRRSYN